MKKLITYFAMVIILYLAISFFELNTNPFYWHPFFRFLMSAIGFCIIVFSLNDYINDDY